MNKKLLIPLWVWKIMRLSFHQFLLCAILCGASYAHKTSGQAILEKRVSLDVQGVRFKKVLSALGEQADVRFVYSSNLIDSQRKVTLKASNQRLDLVLKELLDPYSIEFTVTDGKMISLTPVQPAKGSSIAVPELREEKLTREVRGRVADEKGEALPGVSILLKGTQQGVISDTDGRFSIEVPDGNAVLVFSFVGFVSREVMVGNNSTLEISMEVDEKSLEEVIVVGYGTQKKINLTGAVETVELNTIASRPLTNASAALQGLVSGAFVSQVSGQPGNDNANILIRGVGTFNNNSPLVIIDGMIGDLRDVNPRDMESVSVLKDAASTAIYGNRAANGVILITTKRGREGAMEVSYSGNFGLQNVTQMPELLKGVEYLELKAQAHANSNGGIYPSWYTDEYMGYFRNNVDPIRFPTDYDWVGAVFSPAGIADNHLNISGGQKSFRYAASVGYLNQDGIVVGNQTRKLTIRTNFSSYFLKEKLRFDLNLSGYDQRTKDMVNGMDNAIYSAYVSSSTTRLHYPGIGYSGNAYNWAADAEGGYRNTVNSPITTRMAVNFDILKGLAFNSSYNISKSSSQLEIWKPSVYTYSITEDGDPLRSPPTPSGLENTQQESITKLFDARLSYTQNLFDQLSVTAMGGMETREYTYKSVFTSRNNFSANIPNFSIGDPSTQRNSSQAHNGKWLSYFGRLNASFRDKYLFEATVRKDGSSRFLDKWGVFPSASAGWRISEEAFLKSSRLISDLKLRASWGRLGNESIGQYYAASDELSLSMFANFNNSLFPAGATTKLANKATTWETSEQINIGLDFGLLKNSLSGSVDLFKKTNADILMQLPVSSTLGLSSTPYQNAGAMKNTGIEMALGYAGTVRNVTYRVKALASRTINTITSLAGRDEMISGNMIQREGEAYNSFFGFKTEGIYQSVSEIESHLKFTNESGSSINPYLGLKPEPGDIRFADTNGDGIISNADRVIIGKPYPDWLYSTTIDVSWKGWDLGLFFQGVGGVNSLNQGMITAPFHGGEAATGAWYRNGWTQENPSTTIQRVYSDPNRFNIVSEYYMENASYLRLKNVTIGYSIPTTILRKIHLKNLRVYGNVQNAITWTSMRYGFDPEKPGTTVTTLQYPQTRIFTFGLNLKL